MVDMEQAGHADDGQFGGTYQKGFVYDFQGVRKKWDGRQLRRLCALPGCLKLAVGKKMKCKSHGGGRRCKVDGCTNSAVDSDKCKRHGGGKRCQEEKCNKSAVGTTNFCKMHGGGTRCKIEGCKNSAVSRKLCIRHGGGPRCQVEFCKKGARSPHPYCYAHGGGHRCSVPKCNRPARSKTGRCGKCEEVLKERNSLLAKVEVAMTNSVPQINPLVGPLSPVSLKRTLSNELIQGNVAKMQKLNNITQMQQALNTYSNACLLPQFNQTQIFQNSFLPVNTTATAALPGILEMPQAATLSQLSQTNAMQQYLDTLNSTTNNKHFFLNSPLDSPTGSDTSVKPTFVIN